MTKITFFEKDGLIEGFETKGHAGFAEYGNDIVCASISILVLNTINSITELNGEDVIIETDESSGKIYFYLKSRKEESTEKLLRAMELGLKGIREEYGRKYLELKTKEVNDNVKA